MSELSLFGALLVALGGGLGSTVRFALDTWVTRLARRRADAPAKAFFPWGITLVNVSGSLLLGLLVGVLGAAPDSLVVPAAAAHPAWLGLGVGLLGGFTTLSTASLDTVRLARAGRLAAAALNALGTLGVAVLFALAGVLLGPTFA
ncbi:CrcB family protein [Leucobacter albus]|uniref:Fluoride-specific ion channel FluC n=1 Tax=Leucobacter albus TaxID=272210 RepID=A0ABW3TJV5_9MICO